MSGFLWKGSHFLKKTRPFCFRANFPTLAYFNERIPHKPYCADDFHYGIRITSCEKAMQCRYIQPNAPHAISCLVFDVDRPGAAIDWSDRDCPAPNLSVKSRVNGHAHLIYLLSLAVRKDQDASVKALRYLDKIDRALCLKLGADVNYCGLICKNPNHPDWDVTEWETNLYTLDWLADFVDLSMHSALKITDEPTQGRNCALFNALRHWAYREIRKGCPSYASWSAACLDCAFCLNAQNPVPLPVGEVKSVAKSVARGTFNNPSAKQFAEYVARTHMPEIQAERGQKGGVIGGKVSKGGGRPSLGEPWVELGISRRTYFNWKAKGKI